MIGAVIGDIVGSRFEWQNLKSKDFELFTPKNRFTDDSVMTMAVAQAILDCGGDYSKLSEASQRCMQEWGRLYPDAGFSSLFRKWVMSDNPQPYRSFGNGAAMRISACGFAGSDLSEVKEMARAVTSVSHNHPEGFKAAEAVAVCIYLTRNGRTIKELRRYINKHYYRLNFTLDEVRPVYRFYETCQESVPQALEAFLESNSFEDAIRNAVSIGGDSDTIACIAGALASAYYGVPAIFREKAFSYLDPKQKKLIQEFETCYERKLEYMPAGQG